MEPVQAYSTASVPVKIQTRTFRSRSPYQYTEVCSNIIYRGDATVTIDINN
jgi:hypothetical protein